MKQIVDDAFDTWVLIQQTRDAINNAREKDLSRYGISTREAATLHAISCIGEKATPIQVARWAYRKPQTITGILGRMQKKGLINLNRDPDLRSIVRISMTEKGKRIYKKALSRESIHRIFDGVDYTQLKSCLIILRDKALSDAGDMIHRPFP